MLINDATAIPDTLKRIHDMLWLAGLGWYVVGAAGQMLERSLIDTAVGSPERLVFEGAVILTEPLIQSPRPALAFEGHVIDIANAVLPWGSRDDDAVREIKQRARLALREECEIARARWSASHVRRLTRGACRNPTHAPRSANGLTIANSLESSNCISPTPRLERRPSRRFWQSRTTTWARTCTTYSRILATP